MQNKKLGLWVIMMGLVSGAYAQEKPNRLEVYGFLQTDWVQDFDRVNPAWDDTLRPSKIPTTGGEFGSDGQSIISARQSRFGVQGRLPVEGQDLNTKFEIDMFGVGVDEGQTTIRLRHAYGEWKEWLAGQTHSLFMDIDVFPNTIDYWGPAGMVFLRNPQIRYTPVKGDNIFSIAIEKPSDDIDAGQIRDVDPDFGNDIQSDEKLPDLSAQYRMNRDWGHFQASGILRRIGYETLNQPNNNPKDHELGWGASLSSNIKFLEKDRLILSLTYGQGIASYMNDGGTDLAPKGRPGDLEAKAVPLLGVVAYYDHYWNQKNSSAFGYSRTQVDNTSFQEDNAFHKGEYASVNFLHTPAKNIMMGVEMLWGARTDSNGNYGNDVRSQVSFKYSFSSNDFL